MPSEADNLIETGWQARREGRHGDAEESLARAVAASRAAGPPVVLIRALKALGHVVHDLGQVDRARELYEEAVALSRDAGDDLLFAHTLRHLGDVHRSTGRTGDAEHCYEKAIALYRGVPDAPALDHANALRPMAILKEEAGEVEVARALWAAARDLYEEAGVAEGVEECGRRLASDAVSGQEDPAPVPPPVEFEGAVPILRVSDFEASVTYYVDVLGFTLEWGDHGFGSVRRGAASLMLCEGSQGHAGTWVWLGVGDADALHDELRGRGARIRHAPTNYPWGSRELHVFDPDGHVLRLGSEARPGEPLGEWLDEAGVRWLPRPEGGWTRAEGSP